MCVRVWHKTWLHFKFAKWNAHSAPLYKCKLHYCLACWYCLLIAFGKRWAPVLVRCGATGSFNSNDLYTFLLSTWYFNGLGISRVFHVFHVFTTSWFESLVRSSAHFPQLASYKLDSPPRCPSFFFISRSINSINLAPSSMHSWMEAVFSVEDRFFRRQHFILAGRSLPIDRRPPSAALRRSTVGRRPFSVYTASRSAIGHRPSSTFLISIHLQRLHLSSSFPLRECQPIPLSLSISIFLSPTQADAVSIKWAHLFISFSICSFPVGPQIVANLVNLRFLCHLLSRLGSICSWLDLCPFTTHCALQCIS